MMGLGYQAMLGTHVHNENAISHKAEKEEKPSSKKKNEKHTRCMDGWSNQDPAHYDTHQVYTKDKYEKDKTP